MKLFREELEEIIKFLQAQHGGQGRLTVSKDCHTLLCLEWREANPDASLPSISTTYLPHEAGYETPPGRIAGLQPQKQYDGRVGVVALPGETAEFKVYVEWQIHTPVAKACFTMSRTISKVVPDHLMALRRDGAAR